MSKLESIMAALATKLGAIATGSGYSTTVASVQRYSRTMDRDDVLGNQFATKPVALLRFGSEDYGADEGTIGLTEPTASIEIIYLLDDSTTDAGIVAALADVKKALGDWSALEALGATLRGFRAEAVDPETRMPHDGIRFYLDVQYMHDFDDPATRTG